MIFINYLRFGFARNVKRSLNSALKSTPQVETEQQVEQTKTDEKPKFEKKFVPTAEFRMAQQFSGAIQLPEVIINHGKKIFSKYDPSELRDASYKYMKMYQLLHALEKPRAITIKRNVMFENPEHLQTMTESSVIHLHSPKVQDEELWKTIQERRKAKEEKIDRIDQANEKLEKFNYSQSLIDYDQILVVSYLLRKVPGSYAVSRRILKEIRKRIGNFNPKTFLDFGSGVGPWGWSASEVFPELETIACVEPNENMRKLGKYLSNSYKQIRFMESLSNTFELDFDTFDLISIAYVLEEIARPEARLLILQSLWAKLSDNGIMILVCPGSPTGFRFVNDFRLWIQQQKGYILQPCQHQGVCPLAKEGFQWCHFDQAYYQWPKQAFPKHILEQRIVNEKFSYIVVSKHEIKQEGPEWGRIIFPIMKRGKHNIMDLCTEEGEFKRRIIGKSAGVEGGYYESKKMHSGDLWRFKEQYEMKKKRREKIIKRM